MASTCKRYKQTLFWIDAICIDQSNIAERSHQVAFMADIYRQASQVVAWLGPSYGENDVGMAAMRRVPSQAEMSSIWNDSAAGIRRLCHRPYWTRLWVLQELALAKSHVLHCGQKRIQGANFGRFLEVLKATTFTPSLNQSGLAFDAATCFSSPAWSMISQINTVRRDSLFEQVCRACDLRCRDQKDRVYALLGLTKTNLVNIRPDYNAPMADVIMSVVRNEMLVHPSNATAAVPRYIKELCAALRVDTHAMIEQIADSERLSGLGIYSEEIHQDQMRLIHNVGELSAGLDLADALLTLLLASTQAIPQFIQYWYSNTTRTSRYGLLHTAARQKQRVLFKLLHHIIITRECLAVGSSAQPSSTIERYTKCADGWDNCDRQKLVLADMSVIESTDSFKSHLKARGSARHIEPCSDNSNCLLRYSETTTPKLILETPSFEPYLWLRKNLGTRWPRHHVLFDVNLVDSMSSRETVLYQAVRVSKLQVLERLQHIPALDWNVKDGSGLAPLHIAVQNHHQDRLKQIVEHFTRRRDVNINVRDKFGDTPLADLLLRVHVPAERIEEALDYLLARSDIDVNLADYRGYTPL